MDFLHVAEMELKMADTEDRLDLCVLIDGRYNLITNPSRELLIQLAWERPKAIPSLSSVPIKTPSYFNIVPNAIARIELMIDLSFKLYLKHHTENIRDLKRIKSYITICDALERFYQGYQVINPSLEILLIKMAYPLLGDDTLLDDIAKFFIAVITRDASAAYDPAFLFLFTARLNNYCALITPSLMRYFQPRPAHDAKRTETSEDWMYLGPIFKACAAEIKPEFTADQRGEVFTKYFDEKLKRQLEIHGEWEKREGESDSYTRTRIRKAYFKRFNDWMKRREENANMDIEKKLVDYFENTVWNKTTPEQVFSPIMNHFAKLNFSPEEFEGYLDQMQEFSKGLKLE